MLRLHLTDEQILEDLAAVVSGHEDYRYVDEYNICSYFADNGAPSCIIGHVLARHGVALEDLEDVEHTWLYDVNATAVGDLVYAGLILASEKGSRALSRAQFEQDNRGTWSEALSAAREELRSAR